MATQKKSKRVAGKAVKGIKAARAAKPTKSPEPGKAKEPKKPKAPPAGAKLPAERPTNGPDDRALVAEAVHPGKRAGHALRALSDRIRLAPGPGPASPSKTGERLAKALASLSDRYRYLLDKGR
jgi:hypothetical protein